MRNEKPAYLGRVKYNDQTAQQYQVRKQGKHRAEMRLIDRAFALVPKSCRVLDLPCGGGRVAVHLARQGYDVVAADLSDSMVRIARDTMAKHGLPVLVEQQDIERLTFADRSFDAIVSFRLFHHFPNRDIRRCVVNEMCRVARSYVALSYFSPWSVTSVKRRLTAALGGRKSDKHATPLSEVAEYFTAAGFGLVRDFARLRLIHTLHLALFKRVSEPDAPARLD